MDIRDRIIELRRVKGSELVPNPKNWRRHPQAQRDALKGVVSEIGFAGAELTFTLPDGRLMLIDGHMRAEDFKDSVLPVLVTDLTPEEADTILLTFDPISSQATADRDKLKDLMQKVKTGEEGVQAMLAELAEREKLLKQESFVDNNAKPNPRKLPIDVIYTLQMADCTCCLAVQAGLKYGIQSAHYRLCPYHDQLSGRHEVAFIDNDYFDYKRDVHLDAVKALKPKYATVRDVMTPEQCKSAGIEHYSLEQILEWAYELNDYAENVIVIPKYNCIDDIPEQFMLGYSVPTSHGGTPLPPEMFRGRRVHLLGGSWKAQLAHMAALGDDVVSIDNNHVQNIARQWGQFITPDGNTQQLNDAGLGYLTNPRYAALALSFGAMSAKVNELYAVEEPAL